MRRRGVCAAICWLTLALAACEAIPAESGVIFMYHHVDIGTPAATSVRPNEFLAQMSFLEREGFSVLPLRELLEALQSGASVPERAVAITFDDAYSSVLTEAMPVLRARNWPFTVFVSTESVDAGYRGYLSWDELRELGANGASFGNHSISHAHLVRRLPDESEMAWQQRVAHEIVGARERLLAELGSGVIAAFAYPYGEYTATITSQLAKHERFGLGQQSGAVGSGSDFLALPRYPVATGLPFDEFALRARSRPLPVTLGDPERHILDDNEERPLLRLVLQDGQDIQVAALACYASGQGRMQLDWLGDERRSFAATPERPLGPGRSKYNCTAPSISQAGVYYWYGYLWMRRQPDGSWYDE